MASLGLDIFDSKKFFKRLEAAEKSDWWYRGIGRTPEAKGRWWLKHVENQQDGMVYPVNFTENKPFIYELPIKHIVMVISHN